MLSLYVLLHPLPLLCWDNRVSYLSVIYHGCSEANTFRAAVSLSKRERVTDPFVLAVWCHCDKFCLLVVFLHRLLTVGANPFSTKPQKGRVTKITSVVEEKRMDQQWFDLQGNVSYDENMQHREPYFHQTFSWSPFLMPTFCTRAGRSGETSHWEFWISPGGWFRFLPRFTPLPSALGY